VILVDSSVWIDYFRGKSSPQAEKLDALLGDSLLAVGDLILAEVLQGFGADRQHQRARKVLLDLHCIDLGGREIAVAAADLHRRLRAVGVTPRRTIDTIIATRCITDGLELLHSDRDFDPFEQHLGLRVVDCGA
jgi:hypothetical protein